MYLLKAAVHRLSALGKLWWMTCILGGAMLGAAYSYFFFWPLALLAACPMVIVSLENGVGRAFVSGMLTIIPTVLIACYWMSTVEREGGRALVAIGGGIAMIVMWGVMGIFLAILAKSSRLLILVLIPMAMWGLENLRVRSFVIAPFLGPYFVLGQTQLSPHNPFIQAAGLVGTSGLSAIVMLANIVVVLIYQQQRLTKEIISGLAVLALLAGYGFVPAAKGEGRPLRVGVVQVNVSEDDPRLNTYKRYTPLQHLYTELTVAAANQGASLVVWPEQAVPFSVETFLPAREWLGNLSIRTGAFLLTGGNGVHRDRNGRIEYTNSTFMFTPEGLDPVVHDKEFTAPLETPDFWSPVAEFRKERGWTGAGAAKSMLLENPWISVSGPICFEAVLSMPVRDTVKRGAEFIAISGNDAAFGNRRGAFYSLRHMMGLSVECRRWVGRAANCGYTGFISPRGCLVGMSKPGKCTLSVQTIQLRYDLTPYVYLGAAIDIIPIVALLVVIVLLIYRLVVWAKAKESI